VRIAFRSSRWRRLPSARCALLGGDGGVDEVGAAVELDQRVLEGLVEEVGVDACGSAAGFAVWGAGEARVVAVAAQFAGG
jgi:hypothetical protein